MKFSQTYYTRNRKPIFVICILILTVAVSAVLSICIGTSFLSVKDIFLVLCNKCSDNTISNIVMLVRIPRTVGCLVSGAALAISGATIQTVLGNPLAAPNVIGVNSGAGVMVILISSLFPMQFQYIPAAAFVGALSAVLLVLLIAEKTGASKISLVLSGVAVSAIFSAIIDAVIVFFPDSLSGYSDFKIGGFSNLTMERILPSFWIVLISFILLLSLSTEMDILSLGEETARGLGLRAKPYRILFLAIAAALSGASVCICGLLGFVGLIIPHIVRIFIREGSAYVLYASAFGGAAFVTICDLISRTVFNPYELPVGILLSLVGGPFFIWLLFRQRGGRNND